jgi:hypothetical protein
VALLEADPVSTLRQFRFTEFEQHILFKAVQERIKQVQGDPTRSGYEKYKLQQLLERLARKDPRPNAHERGPENEPHGQADDDRAEPGITPSQGVPPADADG